MSSSFRNGTWVALALLGAGAGSPVQAQQNYFVPSVEVGAEYNSNRELVDLRKDPTTAYIGRLDLRMGRQSPLGHTEIRPRLTVQEFPDREGVDPIEAFLNVHSDYHTLRGAYALIADFARQDTFNVQYGDTLDDIDPTTPIDPNDPVDDDDTGVVLVGVTRTTWRIEPSFQYSLTERNALGARIRYTDVRYSSKDFEEREQRVGYESPYAEATFIRTLNERTHLSIGPYVTRYDADNGLVQTDTIGALIGLHHETERSDVNVELTAESSDITNEVPTPPEETTDSSWGLEVAGHRRNRIGGIRYSVGRFLQPSTIGNRRQRDEIRLQYDRPMTPRFGWIGTVRLSEDTRIGESASTRKRAQGELRLRGFFTRTMFWSGGYRYTWQDVDTVAAQGQNHAVFLSFGYRALDPRPRELR
jgi:hypothetical protein